MVWIRERVYTGGRKEFVYEGDEELGDTTSTKEFKDKYREWINRPRFFSFSRNHPRPVRETYSEHYKHKVVGKSNFKQYIVPVIIAIIIISLFIKWSNDGTFEKFGAKLSEIKQNFTSDIKQSKSEIKENIVTKKDEIEELVKPKEDQLLTKCRESFDECRGISTKKYDWSISIIEIEKFEDADKAEEFYNTWSGLTQTDLETEFRIFDYDLNIEDRFPLVLFALKVKGEGGQLPLVAICDKDGELIKNSKVQLQCGYW